MASDALLRLLKANMKDDRENVAEQTGFLGVNSVDSIYAMPKSHLPYAKNVNLGAPVGAISKIAGREALFDSLGSGKVLGQHIWRHPDGDKFIFAWDEYLYWLTGTSGSVSKTLQEDWEAGTCSDELDTTTSAGDMTLEKPGADFSEADTLTADFNGTHSNTEAASDKVTLTVNSGATFYVTADAAGYDPATERGDWDCSDYGAYKLSKTKSGDITYERHQETGGTGCDVVLGKFVSDGLPSAKTITGTLAWCLGVSAMTAAKFYYHVHAFVTVGDSDTVRGTLLTDYIGTTMWDSVEGLAVSAQAISDVSAQAGDRIVIEVGYRAMNTDDDYYGTLYTGGTSSTDLADGEDSRLYPGWFEFSDDPFATTYNVEGTYTHGAQDIHGAILAGANTITYNKTTPAGTAVTVQTRYTTDGVTWTDWASKSSGDTVIPTSTDISAAGARGQWRAILTSTTGADTPSLDDVTFAVAAGYETSGSWTSPVYDLGSTPLTATLSWSDSEPAGTATYWYARGSANGTVWGDWREITTSGDAIPLQRYIEIMVEMEGTVAAAPTVSSLLISYQTEYSTPNQLDISPLGRTDDLLTGSRVSMEEYDERLYCADGLRSFCLYVDDDTETTGTAQASTELITNNEFETYSGTLDDDTADTFGDWTLWTTGTGRVEAVTGDGATGVAMKVTMTDATAGGNIRGAYQTRALVDMGLSVGDTVSLALRYKMSAQVGAVVRVNVLFLDSGSATLATQWLLGSLTDAQDEYTTVKAENVTIPENTVSIRFQVYIRASGAFSGENNQLWVEYISCVKADEITLASGASAVDDFYNNALITLTDGTGVGQVRFISDYDGTSKIVTVSEAWDTAPDATTEYSIGAAIKARNVGVDAPETACSAAAGAATGITGTFLYKYTYVNRDGYESNPSDASSSVTVSNQKVSLTDVAVGDATIVARKVYRTKTGASVYYYVDTIDDNTTTTYTDTTADTALVTLMYDNNNVPPYASIVYPFLTYLFYVNAEELWFSKAGEGEVVPNTTGDINLIVCPGRILDIKSNPMALIPQGEYFAAPITTNSGFIFDSDPEVDSTTMRVVDRAGSLSYWSSDMCITPDLRSVLVSFTRSGIRTYLPGLQEQSIESIPLSRNVQTYFDYATNRENSAGVYFNGCYIVAFEYLPTGASEAEHIMFMCDFRQESREWYGPIGRGASCFAVGGNVLYAGDPENGIIYREFTGNDDNGADIEMIADLPILAPAGEKYEHEFVSVVLIFSADSDTTETQLKMKLNRPNGRAIEKTVDIGAITSSYTGSERPGDNLLRSKAIRIPASEANSISYRLYDLSSNPVTLLKAITVFTVMELDD